MNHFLGFWIFDCVILAVVASPGLAMDAPDDLGPMDLDILSPSGDKEEDEGPLAAPDDVETPPPLLTIGNVLDTLPKIKSG